jgi:hypothetical protein
LEGASPNRAWKKKKKGNNFPRISQPNLRSHFSFLLLQGLINNNHRIIIMMKFIALVVAALACTSAHADRLGLLRIGSTSTREATVGSDVQRSLFEEDSSLYVLLPCVLYQLFFFLLTGVNEISASSANCLVVWMAA